jgi:hypothetical protein
MHSSLSNFTLVLNSVLPFWKLLFFEFLGEFSIFNVGCSVKNCPSAKCASADNVVYRYFDIFKTKIVSQSCGTFQFIRY